MKSLPHVDSVLQPLIRAAEKLGYENREKNPPHEFSNWVNLQRCIDRLETRDHVADSDYYDVVWFCIREMQRCGMPLGVIESMILDEFDTLGYAHLSTVHLLRKWFNDREKQGINYQHIHASMAALCLRKTCGTEDTTPAAEESLQKLEDLYGRIKRREREDTGSMELSLEGIEISSPHVISINCNLVDSSILSAEAIMRGELTSRTELPHLLRAIGLNNRGVEVGVRYGTHAHHLADNWPGTLHLVDPYRPLDDYDERENFDAEPPHDLLHQRVLSRLWHFVLKGRVVFHRMLSRHAATLFQDESLDFVYIDANHAMREVVRDIAAWYPKVRPGGLIGGHDYLDKPPVYGVKSAVDTFFKDEYVHVTTEDEWPSWFVLKP